MTRPEAMITSSRYSVPVYLILYYSSLIGELNEDLPEKKPAEPQLTDYGSNDSAQMAREKCSSLLTTELDVSTLEPVTT